MNINTPNPVSGLRPLPVWGQINQISPLGEEKYKALFVRLDRAYANRVQYPGVVHPRELHGQQHHLDRCQ